MSNKGTEKQDYSRTLNLPKTDFSMKAGLSQKEPACLESWASQGLYDQLKEKWERSDKDFILHDGPPYANGHIHIGHALNKILKDFIVKFKTMEGCNSFYLPGWDCHGLPIEHQLLKEMKKKKSDVDCVEFRKKAHDYAMKYVDIQREEFKRLGVFGEWKNPYLTLDKNYEYWILKSLAELNKKGYVYRGLKPVNWCYQCETALAEAEVEYEDHTSKSIYVKFEVKNKESIKGLPDKKLSLLIWTTTPWTLLANVAVAVHPAFQYSLVDVGEEILVVETSLSESVLAKAEISDFKKIKTLSGEELTSLIYQHPFGMLDECRVVTADYVTKDDGTGLVHTAPGHGQEDFETGKKHKLETLMPVNDRGIYTDQAPQYKGEHVFKANEKIIEDLDKAKALFASEDIQHTYPHCWRCKKAIIFRATHQWFLKIDHDNLRGRLTDAVKHDVKWIPSSGKERILTMVTTRPDWCLSRQRYWGVPIPALKPKGDNGEPKLFSEVIEHFAEVVKTEGTDAWFEKDAADLIPAGFKDPDSGETEFEKTYDILDVWFDSGVSHQSVLKEMMNRQLPAQMYLEGSDQHRGWFQSSLIPALAIEDKPPFENVLTHGFVVDGQGRKMSKSLGNVIAPQEVIKTNGADILRLWVASSSYSEDVRISKEILDRLIDAYRKIRNTIRYLLGNLHGFEPQADIVSYDELIDIDQWALYHLAAVSEEMHRYYDVYEFAKVYKSLYTFCNEQLSSFYLDILKDRLYTSAANSKERKAAQTVLFYILNHLVRYMAPILSFTAEEIFQAMPKDKESKVAISVHLLPFLEIPNKWKNTKIDERFRFLVNIRPFVLKALENKRQSGEIGSALEAKVTFYCAGDQDFRYLDELKKDLPAMLIVSQVEVVQTEEVTNALGGEFSRISIEINRADGQKCDRCWNYKLDVGQDLDHQTLCARCTAIVKEFT